jgi:hypothetical protein
VLDMTEVVVPLAATFKQFHFNSLGVFQTLQTPELDFCAVA